jgi:hypothetical protein
MAEYLPLYKPGQAITRQASATITAGQLVRVSGSGTVAAVSAASDDWLGVAGFDAVSGDKVTVFMGGVQRCVCTGTVTQGELVEGATAGTVATHTNGTNDVNVVGLALTTATVGNLVEVAFLR